MQSLLSKTSSLATFSAYLPSANALKQKTKQNKNLGQVLNWSKSMCTLSNFKELSSPLPSDELAPVTAKQWMLWSTWTMHGFWPTKRMPRVGRTFSQRQPSGWCLLQRTGCIPRNYKPSALLNIWIWAQLTYPLISVLFIRSNPFLAKSEVWMMCQK